MHWQEKKRTKIGCCLSFAYAEIRLGELWKKSSRAVEVSCRGRGETARAVEHAWRTLDIWERGKGKGESDAVSGREDSDS